jgi:hypothetical protein
MDIGNITYPPNFRPHGLSIFENETYIKLFVISHYELFETHNIEIFEYNTANNIPGRCNSLVHIKTLSHRLITSPNDLIAINFNEFLISNDHGKGNFIKNQMDDMFQFKKSEITYYTGSKFVNLGKGISYGNGILYINDIITSKEYLIRASAKDYTIYNYTIVRNIDGDICDLFLNFEEILPIAPDNLELDLVNHKSILIGGHPSLVQFIGIYLCIYIYI